MQKVLLCVLDGFGHGKDYKGNAITRAKTPFFDELYAHYPWTLLHASGEDVGIPKGTQGGSEVGHLTMGAGRIVLQPLMEIDQSIKDKSFFKKKPLLAAAAHAKKHKSALHILGMISDQGVHAHLSHALALLDFAKKQGLKKVYVHAITDGRDVAPKTAATFIRTLQKHMKKLGVGQLATLVGRYYAMDRDHNWDRTQTAYELLVNGKGKTASDPLKAIAAAYQAGLESDYYLKPILLDPAGLIHKKDSVVFFNFRTDRAAQLTQLFTKKLKPHFLAFGPYTTKAPVVFPVARIKNNLGAVLDRAGLKQLRIAETEKYAHVTFFFNSQIKAPFKHEKRIMVDSPKCPSYAEKPEMSAPGITARLLKELPKDYRFMALNFANLDLVGHSGDFKATVRAVETIDAQLAQIVPAALRAGYAVLITGDHGNAEYKIYEDTGGPCPSHTRNPVPLILASQPLRKLKKSSHTKPTGGLRDLAPTILTLLGRRVPKEMTGHSLI
jgi:2,3-bisphosphoglycerate-independent phosphoglycerate mutase